MVRPAGTAFRSLVVLFITGLWVAFSGWMPAQPSAEERERTSASSGQHAASTITAEHRKRGDSRLAPRSQAADCPPHTSCPILFSSRAVALGSAGTDAVPSVGLRTTRARGPPASRT